MVEGHAPHHYARLKAGENRGISSGTTATNQDAETETHGRTSKPEEFVKRQDWNNMDLSGQGLRVLSTALFRYTFLTELYVASNKITYLPPTIGHLRLLRHLDASSNQLTELPPEIGMCVYLKNLLLFDNSIQTLPNELGSLFQLEMLGIEGNPLDAAMKQAIMEKGTKALISELRESTPGKHNSVMAYLFPANILQYPSHQMRDQSLTCWKGPLPLRTRSGSKSSPIISSATMLHDPSITTRHLKH
jgi:CCR4-NOT transcription complex subunit 6